MTDTAKTIKTADVVLTSSDGWVLLILRRWDPFKGLWALPGGRVDPGENPQVAASRELREETGIYADYRALRKVGTYEDAGRDPRGPYSTTAYALTLPGRKTPRAGDDAEMAAWFKLDDLPNLAFDHEQIIHDAVATRATS